MIFKLYWTPNIRLKPGLRLTVSKRKAWPEMSALSGEYNIVLILTEFAQFIMPK